MEDKIEGIFLGIMLILATIITILAIVLSFSVNGETGFTIKEFVYGSLYNSMDSTKIKLDKTEEITWYRVDSSYYKVSNKGWVYNGN